MCKKKKKLQENKYFDMLILTRNEFVSSVATMKDVLSSKNLWSKAGPKLGKVTLSESSKSCRLSRDQIFTVSSAEPESKNDSSGVKSKT